MLVNPLFYQDANDWVDENCRSLEDEINNAEINAAVASITPCPGTNAE